MRLIRIRNLMHIGKIVIECNCLDLEQLAREDADIKTFNPRQGF